MKDINLDYAKTALVVIDLQKGIVARETYPHTSEVVIKNASDIASAFRKRKMPVFLVRVNSSPDGLG